MGAVASERTKQEKTEIKDKDSFLAENRDDGRNEKNPVPGWPSLSLDSEANSDEKQR
jgi:hypothetical protein